MLLSDFNINDYLSDSYDRHHSYQHLLCEVYDENDEEVLDSFSLYFEIAFVEDDEISMLKVNFDDFEANMNDLKYSIGKDKVATSIVKFFYEDGTDKGVYTRIEVVPVAWVKSMNALYFEAIEQ